MATATGSPELHVRESRTPLPSHPPATRRFEWLVTSMICLTVVGVYLDGWFHNTFAGKIESFLTPSHAILYGGVMLTGAVLGLVWLRNVRAGYLPTAALPRGYTLSFVGFLIFAVGGVFDLIWHTLFGFEVDIEAMLSPSHMVLATGAVLMMSGPLRSAWGSTERLKGWRPLFPALLSLLALISDATFFSQYASIISHAHGISPYNSPADRAALWPAEVSTVSYVLVPATILMTFLLFAIRRWTLPKGAFTFLIGVNAVLMFAETIHYNKWFIVVLLGTLVGGIVADVLYKVLKPSVTNVRGLRLFAFLMPTILFLAIVSSMGFSFGTWWSFDMWLGVPIQAGFIGLGLSLLVAPPAIPNEDK